MTSKGRAIAFALLMVLSIPAGVAFIGTQSIGPSDHDGSAAAESPHGDIVYVAEAESGSSGAVHAYYTANGSIKWSQGGYANVWDATPGPDEETVYIATGDNQLFALDASDGTEKWSTSTYSDRFNNLRVNPDGSEVYAAYHGSEIIAFDASDGAENWRYEDPGSLVMGLGLSPDGSTVYGGDWDNTIHAVSTEDGSPKWTQPGLGGIGRTVTTSTDGSSVFVGAGDGAIYSLDSSDGSIDWSHTIDSSDGISDVQTSPGGDHLMYAHYANEAGRFDISSQSVDWSNSYGDFAQSHAPAPDESKSFVTIQTGEVYELDWSDGTEGWSDATIDDAAYSSDAGSYYAWASASAGDPITGQVVDQDGDPIEDTTLTNLDGDSEATTDSAGEYELLVEEPGTYDIEADAVGYEATVETVDVPEGGTTQDFTLELTDGPFLKEYRPTDGDARDSSGVLLEARIGHHDNDPTSVEFYLRDPDNSTFRKVGEGSGSDGDVVRVSLSDTAGENEWFVELTDGVQSYKSDVFTFRSPGWLDVVDAETEAAIDDRTISAEVTRIAAGLHETETTSTTDGRIEFDGVVAPSSGQWAIELTTDGYEQKTVVYPDLEKGHTTDLIRDDLDWSARYDQTFAIDDRSGSYPPSETVVEAERMIDGSWERVESQLAGSDNRATLELLDGKEYRLKVRNAEGESRVVQQFMGDSNVSDEVVTLSIQSLQEEQEFQQGSWEENDGMDEWESESDYNARPLADLSFSPSDPITGESVSFDASSSTDMDGSIDSYEWNFGSGFTESGETATHTFDEVGATQVTLRVTDDGGLTDRQTRYLYVAEDEESRSNPPTAVIEKRTEDPNVGDLVTLDGSGSIGDGVEIESFEWDLNGDGSFDESGETIEASFDEPGFHRVALQVTDENGATGTEWHSFVVYADEPPGGSSGGGGGSFGPTGEEQSTNPYIVGGVLLVGALFVWRRFFGGSVPNEVREFRR